MWRSRSFVAICQWTAAKLTCLQGAYEEHITSLKILWLGLLASHFTQLRNVFQI